MIKRIRAEWIKERKNVPIMSVHLFVIGIIVLLYLWMTFFTNAEIRQVALKEEHRAGYYSLMLFATMFQRIWGFVYGFLVIRMEFTEDRSDYFVQNTGKFKMLFSKLLVAAVTTLVIVGFLFFIPFAIAHFFGTGSAMKSDIVITLGQIFLIWGMTMGSILIGVATALICEEMLLAGAVVLSLEYFQNLYPKFIIEIWNRLDGYWYFSNLLEYTKNQLSTLTSFTVTLSEEFQKFEGLVWYSILCILLLGIIFGIVNKKEF